MTPSTATRIVLILAGLTGLGVGAGILFAPTAFHASSGIVLTEDPNLMSEIRAAGGAVLACGTLIIAGAFIPRLTVFSALLAAVLYLAYGLSRLISIGLDGMPGSALLGITAFEILIGLICGWTWLCLRARQQVTP